MIFFDDEERILELVRSEGLFKVCFVNFSFGLLRHYFSIRFNALYKSWTNNTESRPDYINNIRKEMIEIMRFDDYVSNGFSQNQVESRKIKAMLNRYIEQNGQIPDKDKVIFFPDVTLDNRSKSDLTMYYDNFERVVRNHSAKVVDYRKNYPGYKVSFLLFDESPSYYETKERLQHSPKPGDLTGRCRRYLPMYDKRFVDVVKSIDADYVIWATPYHDYNVLSPLVTKTVFLIDVPKLRKKQRTVDYDYSKVYCSEVSLEESGNRR
ncbi:MAG: hypothetical protein IJM79_03680 [Erysipelotrichaceae bacterium]|nr:hypothetical protein [Erysipelotrichaceae bacterium]